MTTLESAQKASPASSEGIQRRFAAFTTDSKSFEEIHKTSYGYGLEAIYKLENVDIKSVRRIETQPTPILKKARNKKSEPLPLQEELDLGEEFRGWMPSFVKKEPIQILELSRHAEKCLIENGKKELAHLIGVNLKDFVFLRGMGQGHIEEINQKLNAYLEDLVLDKCYKVDFSSWLKCLVASQDRKRVYAFLESYELTSLFSLTPGENVEVRKLTLEKKQEWAEELLNKIAQPLQKDSVRADMQQIFNVFFKPWIRQRGGFATKDELQERMHRISANPAICLNVLKFLQAVYFENEDFFNLFLQEIDHEVYCCDAFYADNYKKVVVKAKSYFYKPTVYYHLNELVTLIEREFSRLWSGFEEGCIEKIVRLSPAFRSKKGPSGRLEIYTR